jgi:hypothetical protein
MNRWPFRVWLFFFLFAASGLGGKLAFAQSQPAAATSCKLQSADGSIKHVILIIFDNVHLNRDNPNVPSDMELMPHLLNFIGSKGTLDRLPRLQPNGQSSVGLPADSADARHSGYVGVHRRPARQPNHRQRLGPGGSGLLRDNWNATSPS